MKKNESFRTAPAAVLFALCLAAATGVAADSLVEIEPGPASVVPMRLFGTDDQQWIAIRPPKISESSEIVVTAPPRNGYLELEPGVVLYHPVGFIGRDSLTLEAEDRVFEVELRILPRFIAFTGRFDGVYEAPALWDNQTRAFQLCDAWQPGGNQLTCEVVKVLGLAGGTFIPLAWPDSSGSESPVLFEPAVGSFRQLERQADTFWASGPVKMQLFPHGWPIFGDFFGSGTRELAMAAENGDFYLWSDKEWQVWPARQLAVAPGDGLVWPIVLPRLGGDAVALIDSNNGNVNWMRLDPAGVDFGVQIRQASIPDVRRPLAWSRSPLAAITPDFPIFFLEDTGLFFQLRAGSYIPGHPTIIPVKFPDDPIGGGGGGGGG
jgi:hypothetical protein